MRRWSPLTEPKKKKRYYAGHDCNCLYPWKYLKKLIFVKRASQSRIIQGPKSWQKPQWHEWVWDCVVHCKCVGGHVEWFVSFQCRDCTGPLNATVCGRDLLFATGAKKNSLGIYPNKMLTLHFTLENSKWFLMCISAYNMQSQGCPEHFRVQGNVHYWFTLESERLGYVHNTGLY